MLAERVGPDMPVRVRDALCREAYRRAGIILGEDKETLLKTRVLRRMRELGLTDFNEYLRRVERNNEEGEHFVNAITTNTTYFFREGAHFDSITELIRSWRQGGQRTLRIWCAAASTGQEPYTLAMVAHKAVGFSMDVRILATDIDTRALMEARRAVYPKEQSNRAPLTHREYFIPAQDGTVTVAPQIKRLVSLGRLNLKEPPYRMKGPFDLIFCRNVMIYFDIPTRQGIVRESERLLRPGGRLYIGHAESVNGLTRKLKMLSPSVYERTP